MDLTYNTVTCQATHNTSEFTFWKMGNSNAVRLKNNISLKYKTSQDE